MIVINEIKDRDSITFGRKYEGQVLRGHMAEIEPKQYIRIYGQEWNHKDAPLHFDKTFRIGDEAEYHSYNLIYTGTITAIGPKTIEITAYGTKRHRLTIYNFSWRNWDFDSVKIAKENFNEMQCI